MCGSLINSSLPLFIINDGVSHLYSGGGKALREIPGASGKIELLLTCLTLSGSYMAKTRSTLVIDKRLHAGVTAAPQYLTGLDLFHTHANFPLVLVFKKGLDLALVERALVETLKHYPIIAGRYKKDAQGKVYADANDAGVDFRVHRCQGAMPYGLHNPLGKRVNDLVKMVMPWQMVDRDTPFLQVNIHQFEDGASVLCCYVPHSLFDGASFWGFLLDWSRACRGQAIKTPFFDRQILIDAGKKPIDETSYDLMMQPSLMGLMGLYARFGWRVATDMSREVFRIPAAVIEQWRAQGTQEPGVSNASTVSSGSLVAAYVMKAISPQLPAGVERSIGLVLDLRYRKQMGIPREYFGNALAYGEVRYSARVIEQEGLCALAEKCRPAPEQVSVESLYKMLSLTESSRQKNATWRLLFKPSAETLNAGMILNNCVQLPMYDIDLGSGCPDWFEMLPATIRMLLVVQTPQKDGGVDLHLSARKGELRALRDRLIADGVNVA